MTIGEDISCPNFFPLGDKWMLLCISHPLGCRYYIGDWDAKAEQFVPQKHGRMNWPRDDQPVLGAFPAHGLLRPESVPTPDGRRVMWAWVTSAGPDNQLLNKTIQSLPRELSLPADGVLRIKPLRELEGQRLDPQTLARRDARPPRHGSCRPRSARRAASATHRRTARRRRGDPHRHPPRTRPRGNCWASCSSPTARAAACPSCSAPKPARCASARPNAPFAVADLPAGEDVELRIFVDKYLVEVFANDRQAVLAAHLDHRGKRGLDAFTVGAPTTLKRVDIWPLKPTNQGFRNAQQNRNWEPETE